MNVSTVQQALVDALDPIVRTSRWIGQVTSPPVAAVALPDVVYDSVHADGEHQMAWTVFVLVGRPNDRGTVDLAAEFMSTDEVLGNKSIKVALETDPTLQGIVDTLRVEACELSVVSVAETDFLVAEFTVDVRAS